jgi:NAD-dependent SIR2 family protein deacetylase
VPLVLEKLSVVTSILKEGSAVALTSENLTNVPTVEEYSSEPFRYWREYSILFKTPSISHSYLSRLQKLGLLREIITRDVTGSYQAAGCERVVELNGRIEMGECLNCGGESLLVNLRKDISPVCGNCNGLIIPSIYLSPNKEALNEAVRAVSNCNALLLMNIEESNQYPFSFLTWTAKRYGSKLIGFGSASDPNIDVCLNVEPELTLGRLFEDL